MKTKLTKHINLTLEPGDLLRFFRVLDYVNGQIPTDGISIMAKADASLLLNELREIRNIVKSDETPKYLDVTFNVEVEYQYMSDNITITDIIVPGESLPEVTEEVFKEAPPLVEIESRIGYNA